MYIEYSPIDLFDEAEQHLEYPAAASTNFGFGVSVVGGADDDDGGGGSIDICDNDDISIVQNVNGIYELKSNRRPTKRKCIELPPAQKSAKNIKRNFLGSSGSQISGGTASSSIPMGFDILSKLRKFFTQYTDDRKRRADDGDWNSASQFKYRRVDNKFPKFVKKSFEEDEIKIVPQRLHKSPLVMAQHNQKEKRSQFQRPKTVTKHITNTNFADIEFSDDDDAEYILTKSLGKTVVPSSSRPVLPRANYMASTSSVKMPKIPPPPLIEASTGNILVSTLMPDLQPVCHQPTYSSMVSACTNGFDGIGAAAPKRSTAKETIHRTSPFLFNGGNKFSLLNFETCRKDQEQYRELLKKTVPNLYGLERTSPKLAIPTKTRLSINRTKEPVSINCADRSTAASNRKASIGENVLTLELSDDDGDEVSEIIDLANDELNMLSACSKLQEDQAECTYDVKKRAAEKKNQLPYVEPVNSLKELFGRAPVFKNDWLENFHNKWQKKHLEGKQKIVETEKDKNKRTSRVEERSAETRDKEKQMHQRLKELQIVDPELIIVDDFPEGEEEPEYPAITPEHEVIIKGALFGGPPDQMLISKFNMSITRRDISTLFGKTWLNDEVINFYMNLLTERGETRNEEGLPKVYAMNTFFVPRLVQSGHSGVRRWTRKVDIFTYDILPVPVHVGGVHWCMAIIHLRDRSIKYYDSMGTPNPKILSALEQYLREESMDKRKRPFDTSGFRIESVDNVPQQNNGSDCGVFSCMFAEFICRDREITFSQNNMDYFRHKMILEIVQGQLMQ